MKVLYHIGREVNADTVIRQGLLHGDIQRMYIEDQSDKTRYLLDDLRQVDMVRFGLGRMVKVVNGEDTLFLMVPRLFLNWGSGFAIGNFRATGKAGSLLSSEMQRQRQCRSDIVAEQRRGMPWHGE